MNKNVMFFLLQNQREQEVRKGPAWGGRYKWEGDGGKERTWKGEYGANTVFSCI
jgi:hypothetical protein